MCCVAGPYVTVKIINNSFLVKRKVLFISVEDALRLDLLLWMKCQILKSDFQSGQILFKSCFLGRQCANDMLVLALWIVFSALLLLVLISSEKWIWIRLLCSLLWWWRYVWQRRINDVRRSNGMIADMVLLDNCLDCSYWDCISPTQE